MSLLVSVAKKILVFVFLLVVAVVLASAYGVVHNQISFTVSPEYFTKYKFQQFGLVDSPLPERVRASIVGFEASWWMGPPIGLLVGVAGFLHRGHRRMLKVSLQSFVIVMAFTLIVGLFGLLCGYLVTGSIATEELSGWTPEDVVEPRRFVCAGFMHNSSYLGGALSVLAAWVFHVVVLIKGRRQGMRHRPPRTKRRSEGDDEGARSRRFP